MRLALFFFQSVAEPTEPYRLVLEATRFADRHGFSAVWTPERHFHRFGGPFPAPSVLAAALAVRTRRVGLRAGSVVLPLHDPVRVVEEWAVVDHLSAGRVGLSFAAGYSPDDFALNPAAYAERDGRLEAGIDEARRLWRGEPVRRRNGEGGWVELRVHPRPRQSDLPLWLTCGGSSDAKFVRAGELGARVLTALFVQDLPTLARRIALYREAHRRSGGDGGFVTLAVHTYVDESLAACRDVVREPFSAYLRDSVAVWRRGFERLRRVRPTQEEGLVAYAFERYFRTAAVFGDPATARDVLRRIAAAGVDEVACLIDFGVDAERVLASLSRLAALGIHG